MSRSLNCGIEVILSGANIIEVSSSRILKDVNALSNFFFDNI